MTDVQKSDLLVVDDDHLNRMLIGKYLENEGHRVSFASDGFEALVKLAEKSFDMVLLDIEMPEMNGYQVLEQMVGDPHLRDIPVIVTSAIEQLDSVVRCIEMGAEDYLIKPVNRILLKARIDASLEKKHLRDKQAKHLRQLEREMDIARETQLSVLPDHLPELEGYIMGAKIIPAKAVGGDFYDVIDFGSQRWGFMIGDVSDKGLPAALFMTLTYSLLRAEASRQTPPKQALINVNRTLMSMNSASMFVTILCGVLDCQLGTFSFARAGHPVPMVLSPDGEFIKVPVNASQAVGLSDGIIVDAQTIPFPVGGLILMFSDGLSEACNNKDEQFGETNLSNFLQDHRHLDPQEICEALWKEVQRYSGDQPQQDDFTILAIRSVLGHP
jgi:sigma-B regulation protein RsbU (phosphoserine phosphatase)